MKNIRYFFEITVESRWNNGLIRRISSQESLYSFDEAWDHILLIMYHPNDKNIFYTNLHSIISVYIWRTTPHRNWPKIRLSAELSFDRYILYYPDSQIQEIIGISVNDLRYYNNLRQKYIERYTPRFMLHYINKVVQQQNQLPTPRGEFFL